MWSLELSEGSSFVRKLDRCISISFRNCPVRHRFAMGHAPAP